MKIFAVVVFLAMTTGAGAFTTERIPGMTIPDKIRYSFESSEICSIFQAHLKAKGLSGDVVEFTHGRYATGNMETPFYLVRIGSGEYRVKYFFEQYQVVDVLQEYFKKKKLPGRIVDFYWISASINGVFYSVITQ